MIPILKGFWILGDRILLTVRRYESEVDEEDLDLKVVSFVRVRLVGDQMDDSTKSRRCCRSYLPHAHQLIL